MTRRSLILLFVGIIAILGVLWLKPWKPPTDPGFDQSKNALPGKTMKVLDEGERFVLLAIDPFPRSASDSSLPRAKEVFHDFGILGKAEIRDVAQRKALLKALYQGIADSDGQVAACFNPRHGISASLGEETVDLLICFECLSIRTYAKHGKSVLTSDSSQQAFNLALEKAGLPLAK